jgi:hypothetical protein
MVISPRLGDHRFAVWLHANFLGISIRNASMEFESRGGLTRFLGMCVLRALPEHSLMEINLNKIFSNIVGNITQARSTCDGDRNSK